MGFSFVSGGRYQRPLDYIQAIDFKQFLTEQSRSSRAPCAARYRRKRKRSAIVPESTAF
jgi:hypothetical protein